MEDKKTKEYRFLQEETKKVPTNKKKFVMRLGCVVMFAAVFGVVAGFAFGLTKSGVEKKTSEEEVPTLSELTQEQPEVVTEQIYIQETVDLSMEDYEKLQTQLYRIGSTAAKSVVEIKSVTNQKDWFADDYEKKGQSSGVILDTEGSEILILTETAMIADANQIQVVFYGDEMVEAYLKSYDGSTGVAILAVSQRDVSENTKNVIKAVEIADSVNTTPGAFVIGIGSPQGEAGSVVVGNITASNYKVSFSDKNYRLFSTDMKMYSSTRGVLLNSEGKVVGLIHQGSDENILEAIAISELTGLIDRLKSGKRPGYLGVEISEVTKSVSQDYNLPDGIYIKEVDIESPAMMAGLQVGDIIIRIDGTDVLTELAFEAVMTAADPEQKLNITVLRQGSDDQYQEVSCQVELGVIE